MENNIWTYPSNTMKKPLDVQGFDVVATDGEIGKIDEATYDVGSSYIVVDTGPWIFGRKVLLPAGVIERIDLDGRNASVRLTKDQIKNAPEFDPDNGYRDEAYREQVGTYYGSYVS